MISKVEADAQAIMWLAFASDRHSALEITDYAERYQGPAAIAAWGGEHQHRGPAGALAALKLSGGTLNIYSEIGLSCSLGSSPRMGS